MVSEREADQDMEKSDYKTVPHILLAMIWKLDEAVKYVRLEPVFQTQRYDGRGIDSFGEIDKKGSWL